MCSWTWRFTWVGFLFVAFGGGCSTKPADRPADDDERVVRRTFAELQSAIKNHDADKLWGLMDSKSRAEAEKTAKDIQAARAKASAEEKAKQEEALGLTETELAELTGRGILKSKRFQNKYHELPESQIEKVAVQADNATVHYLEPDGDHEKMILVRQEGQWKVWLAMPRFGKP
jgi:hypothetical protein